MKTAPRSPESTENVTQYRRETPGANKFIVSRRSATWNETNQSPHQKVVVE